MVDVHRQSDLAPAAIREARVLALDAWRRAEGMGLVPPADAPHLPRLFERLRRAGVARLPAAHVDAVDGPSAVELAALLRLVIEALEASPVPRFEWPAVSRVLDADLLARLLDISEVSLRRYAAGERETPDEIAARLHHLALVVGDLAGAYNDVGIRRWFHRTRTALNGRAPVALLSGGWNPDDPGPQQVRALARSLVTFSST